MKKHVRISSYNAVIEAAFRILGENPSAPLAEVALAAGVGRATLHRHFKGRDDLMRVLSHQAAKELEAAANAAAKGAWSNINAMKRILFALVPLGERQMFLMSGAAEQFPDVQSELDRQNAEFMDIIMAAGKEGLYSKACPPEWVVQAYDMMIFGAWQMVKDGHATPKQAANLAWSTFKAGLKKAKL